MYSERVQGRVLGNKYRIYYVKASNVAGPHTRWAKATYEGGYIHKITSV